MSIALPEPVLPEPVSAAPGFPEQRAGPAAWYGLAVLILVCITNYIDRSMVSIVLEPVRQEFGLSDSQLGTLSGLAHAAAYALFGIPIGMLVDRLHRVRLLAFLLFVWSAMTALASQMVSYAGLLLTRAAVGGAESGCVPASISLISDLFPARRRATAIGLFFTAGPVGFAISFAAGGYLVANFGWRMAFLAAGIPGFILAILLLSVREPRSSRPAPVDRRNDAAPPLKDAVVALARNFPLCAAVSGMVLSALTTSAFWSWIASFLIRVHEMPLQNVGLLIALTASGSGLLGGLLGGVLSDRFSGGSSRKSGYFIAILHLLILPAALVTLTAGHAVLLFSALALWQLLMPMYLGPAYGLCVGLTEPRMRGTILSFIQLFSNLLGAGLGPFLVGVLSDIYGGAASLRYALLTVAAFNAIAALLYWTAARHMPNVVIDLVPSATPGTAP